MKINTFPKFIRRRIPKLRYLWNILQFFTKNSGLAKMGWFKSAWKEESVDVKNNPIPWITFSAVHFLTPRITKEMNVFEFGSGNSTFWWAKQAKSVLAVEHDEFWKNKMEKILPKNATIIHRELEDGYEKSIKETTTKYDIVFIDGRNRAECARNVIKNLSDKGVVIWDNTDRERYVEGIKTIKKLGYKQLEFYGMTPIDNMVGATSVFYKKNNILGI